MLNTPSTISLIPTTTFRMDFGPNICSVSLRPFKEQPQRLPVLSELKCQRPLLQLPLRQQPLRPWLPWSPQQLTPPRRATRWWSNLRTLPSWRIAIIITIHVCKFKTLFWSTTGAIEVPSNAEFTVVFGKRRGACTVCVSECSSYKGTGGPCNECGCYPTAHLNLDEPRMASRKRRRTSEVGFEMEEDDSPVKRPKYLLEVKYYQKLFFSCLQFMTLPQISAVCSRAPVPIFVKVRLTFPSNFPTLTFLDFSHCFLGL